VKKYPEYKDSSVTWIGHIPSHWGIRRLRHLGIARNGLTYSPEDIVEEGIKVLRSSNIQNNALNFNDTVFIQMRVPSNLVLKEGDLLICSRNGSRELIGKCALIDKETEGNTYGAFMCVFRSKYNRFIQKVFQGDVFDYYLATFTTATINQLTNSNLYNIQIPFPPDKEQEAIVEYLEHVTQQIDTLLADLQSQAEMLDRYKRELIANVVTSGLDKAALRKDSGADWIGKVPSHWEMTTLRAFLKAVSVKNSVDLPLLSVEREKGVVDRETEGSENNHNRIPDDLSNYKVVRTGDFVMNKMKAWRGSYGVSRYDGIVSPAYYVFALNFPNPAFFNYAIRSTKYIGFFGRDSYGIRTDQWDFKIERIKDIPFAVPPVEEQQAIVEYLDNKIPLIEGLLADIGEQIEKLKQYRKIVIHDAVTGKIKVTEG